MEASHLCARFLLAAACISPLAACTSDTKEYLVCLDLIKGMAVDPRSVAVNSYSENSYSIPNLSELRALLVRVDGRDLNQAEIEIAASEYRAGRSAKRLQVSMDVTFEDSDGKARENLLCQFLEFRDKKELIAFSLGRRDMNRSNFREFFGTRQHPNSLDASFGIK